MILHAGFLWRWKTDGVGRFTGWTASSCHQTDYLMRKYPTFPTQSARKDHSWNTIGWHKSISLQSRHCCRLHHTCMAQGATNALSRHGNLDQLPDAQHRKLTHPMIDRPTLQSYARLAPVCSQDPSASKVVKCKPNSAAAACHAPLRVSVLLLK